MFGMWAACSGVLPPSDSCGSSAQPSGMTMAYFMRESLIGERTDAEARSDSVGTEGPLGNRVSGGQAIAFPVVSSRFYEPGY